jgi:hypothetical protein
MNETLGVGLVVAEANFYFMIRQHKSTLHRQGASTMSNAPVFQMRLAIVVISASSTNSAPARRELQIGYKRL